MDILVPKNIFLRVKDKFVPAFIEKDEAVASSPTVVYKKLFVACSDTGKSQLPQKYLSAKCKFSVRTLQYALHRLTDLGYIYVEHEAGGCNTYILLLSEYVMRQLEGYDLIDRSNWYPRSEQQACPEEFCPEEVCLEESCAEGACLEETSPEQPSPDLPADTPIPPLQDVQGGYAKAAPSSYNVDKNNKKKTPPTPLPAPRPFRGDSPVSSDCTGGGDSFSCAQDAKQKATKLEKANLQALFLQLWAVWPVKNDFARARRAFFALAKSGILPSMDELLTLVEKYKAQDSRWKNGYVRWLSNWLRGHCWLEEPLVRETRPFCPAKASPNASPLVPESPEALAKAAHLQQQVAEITRRLQQPILGRGNTPAQPPAKLSTAASASAETSAPGASTSPGLPSWLTSTADELCALWPKPASRTPVQAFLRYLLASGAAPNTATLFGKAREYLRDSLQPMPLVNWLRHQHEELCL